MSNRKKIAIVVLIILTAILGIASFIIAWQLQQGTAPDDTSAGADNCCHDDAWLRSKGYKDAEGCQGDQWDEGFNACAGGQCDSCKKDPGPPSGGGGSCDNPAWCATFECPNGDTNDDGMCTDRDSGSSMYCRSGSSCSPPTTCGQVDFYSGGTQCKSFDKYCGHDMYDLSKCGGGGGEAPRCGDGVCNQNSEKCDRNANCVSGGAFSAGECRPNCTYCGDGVKQTGEECDDGNTNNNDNCNNNCKTVELDKTYYWCDPNSGETTCGHSGQYTSETACESANPGVDCFANQTTCNSGARQRCAVDIQTETYYWCNPNSGDTSCGRSGKYTSKAECESINSGAICYESKSTCDTNAPTVCAAPPSCGNDTCDTGETCDGTQTCPDGGELPENTVCRADCTFCGDGVVQTGETCDDGNLVDDDLCSNSCQKNILGCNEVCEEDEDCIDDLICSDGLCRNKSCKKKENCICDIPETALFDDTTDQILIGIMIIILGIVLYKYQLLSRSFYAFTGSKLRFIFAPVDENIREELSLELKIRKAQKKREKINKDRNKFENRFK